MTEPTDATTTGDTTTVDAAPVDQTNEAPASAAPPVSDLINIHPNTPPVAGYRNLTQAEVDLINQIKAAGVQLGELVDTVRATKNIDQRWASIAATDFQTGLMALVRAVARPTTF